MDAQPGPGLLPTTWWEWVLMVGCYVFLAWSSWFFVQMMRHRE